MSSRRQRTRVIGPCGDGYRADPYCCPSAPYQVPWMIGPTGPTGPSGGSVNGQTPVEQSMLDEYSTTNINYSSALSAPGNVTASLQSDDPYFAERFQGLTISNSTTIGFAATVKMEYGARDIIDENTDDISFDSFSSIALLASGTPAISYATHNVSTGGINIQFASCSSQDGRGIWTSNSIITFATENLSISKLLVNEAGYPGLFRQVSGNFRITYNASSTSNGNAGTWSAQIVYSPPGGESTVGIVASLNGFGFPSVATGLLAGGTTNLTFFHADDMAGTTWTSSTIATEVAVLTPLSMTLNSLNTPAIVYFNGTILKYRSCSAPSGVGLWGVLPNIETNANIELPSVKLCIILSNGLPAVFYKVTGVDGITLAINAAANGSGAWTLYNIIPSLTSFASTRQTLFPMNLKNGNIGLMYTSPDGLMFGIASPSTPSVWTTHLVDDLLTGTGYYPSGVQLLSGHPAVTYTAYDADATVIYGRSAILNDLRFLDETDFTVNWVVQS